MVEQSLESESNMDREESLPELATSTTAAVEIPATDRPPSFGSRRKLVAVIGGILVMVGLISLWLVIRNRTNRANAPAPADRAAQTPTVATSRVVSKDVERQLHLPGELRAYQDVAIYPKVQG